MVDGCGTIFCHPKWLQRYARTRWFLIIYGLLGTIQAASYLYFVVTLTTIEKRFKIPSQTTGIILSGNEISQILLSLILSYAGGQRNRPRWIAWGVIFSALSCFILAWPHFIYGAGDDALKYTEEYSNTMYKNSTTGPSAKTVPRSIQSKLCQTETEPNDCDEVFSYLPLFLIFISQFVLGIGNTLYYSLGQSYLDDNTHHRNTPLMLAYTFSMRMFGPVLGIGLAYLALNFYIEPTLTPIITKSDPRWLGAWWLGWILLGGLMFIFAFFIGMFPKHLPTERKRTIADQEECNQVFEVTGNSDHSKDANLKDFSQAFMRLLRNKLIIYNSISTIFYILGSAGFLTFMSRVMEVQFNQSPHGGSILTGPLTIMGMVIGLLISGYYISKRKPLPKYLFFWNVIVGLTSMCGSLIYANLGCDDGNTLMLNGSIRSCNENCFCDSVSYSPVCDNVTMETFFSPCHSGCPDYDSQLNVYTNCSCTELTHIDSNVWLAATTLAIAHIPSIIINDSNIVNNAIAITKFPIIRRPTADIDGTMSLNGTKSKIEERQTTLFEIYDERLDLGPHDDPIDINNNEVSDDESSLKDSQEQLLDKDDDEVSETKSTMRKRHIESPTRNIIHGACFSNCNFAYRTFTVISFICSLLSSTGRIGNILISFRAVEPRDKSISQGFSLFVISLFALIPAPIIFGRIIDSTCLSWIYKCGRQGNCQLYDSIKFRQLLHFTSAGFIFVAVMFDLLVWYFGRDLVLYGEDDEKKPKNESDESTEKEPLNK